MTLNRRLLLGITPVLILFLALGIYAITLFLKLGNAIDVILRENYQSIAAAQHMKEASERMNASLLLALNGEEAKARDLFQSSLPIFEKNLDIEAHNITLPGEDDLEAHVQQFYGQYRDLAQKYFSLNPNDPERRALYFRELEPKYLEVDATADRILEINQENMMVANQAARHQSSQAARYMLATLVIGFLFATGVMYLLARSIIQPVRRLTESALLLGDGNLDQHVTVQSKDELGKLAEAFNKLAAKLRSYRQSTTETILHAQQNTENALRAFPDPIFVFSPTREIKLQNAAASTFTKLLGVSLLSLEALSRQIDLSLQGAPDFQPTSFDKALLINLGGSEKFFLPRVLAIKNDVGMPIGVVVALQDVTRFRVADDVKTDLIATVSHELKTPLTSMQMAIYLLLEEKVGPLTPKQTELLLAAQSNSDRLFEMIEDLLDLARFEGGAGLVEKKPISAQQLVEEISQRESELILSRGLTMKIKIDPNLPRVAASRPRIDQVFANFISNAVKYAPPGSTVTLSAKQEGANSVRFVVADEGAGVPVELQRRIFDKFFRISKTDEGAGLGLSIAREIVLAHGGQIGVENGKEGGSEFFFTLPAAF